MKLSCNECENKNKFLKRVITESTIDAEGIQKSEISKKTYYFCADCQIFGSIHSEIE